MARRRRRVNFGCSLPEDLLEEIDRRREGLIPRTEFIQILILIGLQGNYKVKGLVEGWGHELHRPYRPSK